MPQPRRCNAPCAGRKGVRGPAGDRRNFAIRRALLGAAGLGGIDRSARCGDPLHTDIGRLMPGYFRIEISEASGQADRDNGEADPPALSLPGDRKKHTSELQSLMRISYAVFCLNKKNRTAKVNTTK